MGIVITEIRETNNRRVIKKKNKKKHVHFRTVIGGYTYVSIFANFKWQQNYVASTGVLEVLFVLHEWLRFMCATFLNQLKDSVTDFNEIQYSDSVTHDANDDG